MKAFLQETYGPPSEVLRLGQLETPAVGHGQVLVRVKATSVNTPDWAMVVGFPYVLRLAFGLTKPATPVRGSDVAGIVEAVGSGVDGFRPGDEVFGSSWDDSFSKRAGTFAEFTVAQADRLIHKPASVSFEDGASVMSALTALIAVRDTAAIQPGMRVLVNGASGAVGTYAVQIAKALGAEVTGVCSGKNVSLVESLGADRVIDYEREDFTARDERYDVILDNVLNRPPRQSARALAPGGLFVPNSIGVGGRWFAGLPRMASAMAMGVAGTRVKGADFTVTRQLLEDYRELLESGKVKSATDSVYPLAEAVAAVERKMSRHSAGNVVITVP